MHNRVDSRPDLNHNDSLARNICELLQLAERLPATASDEPLRRACRRTKRAFGPLAAALAYMQFVLRSSARVYGEFRNGELVA